MRTVQVSGIKSWGGGEQQLLYLCQEIEKKHPEVENTVFCPEGSSLIDKLIANDIKVQHPKLKIKTDPSFFLSLGRYCKINKVDVVHAHDPIAMFLVILASYFYKMPKCIYSKKTSFPIKQRRKTLYKYNHKIFDKIICVSNAVKTETIKAVTDTSKLVTIYDGIEILKTKYYPENHLRKILKLDHSIPIILNIGNHTKPKDLSTFLKTANEVLKITKNIHFAQIGRHTVHTQPLLEEIKELELQDNVTFLGAINNASSLISQATIFLHTSKSEGLGQVILEAMLQEKPVISTNVGGIPEIISDGANGLLAATGDFEKLSNHILSVLSKKVSISSLTQGNTDLVNIKFSKEIMAQNTVNLYYEMTRENL